MIARALVISILCASAFGRTPEGTLGALRLPNNARPAMVHAGEPFVVEALRRGEFRAVNDTAEYPLAPEWKESGDGVARATVTVPADAAPGAYTLEWSEGDEGDRNTRAVYVLPTAVEQTNPFSQQYGVACVSIDLNEGDSKSATTSISAIDPARAQFAVLFVRGDEAHFAEALAALDASQVPTVVVIDSTETVAQRWFGSRTFMFRYGPDAFIALATGADGLGDELGTGPETFARLRRECKDARRTVGLFAHAGEAMAMRNEITLNADNAFHVGLYGAAVTAPATQAHAWAGWFEPAKDYTLPANRVVVFAANRIKLEPAQPAPKSP